MPVSEIDGCSESHWASVLEIIQEALIDEDMDVELVSNADESGIIHQRIVENLYSNEIIICDVSGKNPNVMFELGLRLAFDRPAVVVKDDLTDYSFDTSPIEHIPYRRDLRYHEIGKFKIALRTKVMETIKKKENDPEYSTYIKHFVQYTPVQLTTVEKPILDMISMKLDDLSSRMSRMERTSGEFVTKQLMPLKIRLSGIKAIQIRGSLEPGVLNNMQNYFQIFHGVNIEETAIAGNTRLLVTKGNLPKAVFVHWAKDHLIDYDYNITEYGDP